MNVQFLYELSKDRLEKQNVRSNLHCDRLDFFMGGSGEPIFSVPFSAASSISKVNNMLKERGRADLLETLKILRCVDIADYGRESVYNGFIKVDNTWYKLPKDVAWRLENGNMRLVEKTRLSAVNTSYYGRDCTTYGQCPICGYAVSNGMGHTDHFCGRCKQLINWR